MANNYFLLCIIPYITNFKIELTESGSVALRSAIPTASAWSSSTVISRFPWMKAGAPVFLVTNTLTLVKALFVGSVVLKASTRIK